MPAGDTDWMGDALCGGVLGFTNLPTEVQQSICDRCPVRIPCLAYGMRIRGTGRKARRGFKESGTVYGGFAADKITSKLEALL